MCFALYINIIITKIYEQKCKFCIVFDLDVNLSKAKIMVFGCNKRKLNQETFYLGKNQNEITHHYKYLGIDSYSHGHFEPSNKRQRIVCMKVVMCTLRIETIVGFTSWEFESHLLKALVLQLSHMALKFGETTWKTLIERFLRRPWRCI